jgi:hypothetical protein
VEWVGEVKVTLGAIGDRGWDVEGGMWWLGRKKGNVQMNDCRGINAFPRLPLNRIHHVSDATWTCFAISGQGSP